MKEFPFNLCNCVRAIAKMHGRPRNPTKPVDEAASAAKASKLRALQSQFLHFHHNQIYDKEALEVSAKLLEINPEFYTAWNFRKLAADHLLSQPDPDPTSILNEELRVAETALRQNFKSYGAWHHRKWVLNKGHSSVDFELRLLDKFQKADPRNFHAWNYRRFVAALKSIAEEVELKYTTDMIETNFSNYSAWHNRSILLSNLLRRKAEGFFTKEKILTEEYELVHQAIFTDPDDQSGWFYHLWLLEQTIKQDPPCLISSWPACGSELCVPYSSAVSSFTSDPADRNMIPLILYFNQAVRGVNTSAIAVTCPHVNSDDLIWRPLSSNKYEGTRCWVALLKFPATKIDTTTCLVEVNLKDSHGIVTLSGCSMSNGFHSKFEVRFQQPDAQLIEEQSTKPFAWDESNFENDDMNSEKSHLIPPFKHLQINKDQAGVTSKWQLETLNNEIELFRELLTAADCKIGKLTLAKLLTALDTIALESSSSNTCEMVHTEEILSLYKDLINMDPSHSHYYEEQHSLALLQKITCNKENLLRFCQHWRSPSISNAGSALCVRLNNLSLARIGFLERLLWVQSLDLSHNDLKSIEGLEALQLLSCVNLSNNKIKSFTALDPLRHLKLLKLLNISNNEIGKHSIDTTRYLCASTLSHTITNEWKSIPSSVEDAQAVKYWEAFLIFRDLTLIQLDVAGNSAVDEDFRSFLHKVLPTLKWLDGES